MKLIRFLAAAALALTATTAMAQGGGQGMAQMMFQGITLTDVQKPKVDSIVAAAREANQKFRAEAQAAGGQPSPELRAKMTDVTNKRNDAIKALLTADQQTVFAKNLADMAAAAAARQRPPR